MHSRKMLSVSESVSSESDWLGSGPGQGGGGLLNVSSYISGCEHSG